MQRKKMCIGILGLMQALFLFLPASRAVAADDPLTLLLVPVEEENVVFRQFLPVKHYLEKRLNRRVELDIAHNAEAALDRLGQGQVDLAYLDPSAYCEGKSMYQLHPVAKVVKNGEGQYRSVLVVRDDSQVEKIVQIPGRSLALGNTRSSSAYLMPLAMLQEIKLDLEDFSQVGFLQKEDLVALSVLVRDYDVGAMSQEVARKYLPYGLRIIKKSEKLPQFIISSAPQMDVEERNALQTALLEYTPQDFDTVSFAEAEDREYNVVRIMLKNITGKDYLAYPEGAVKLALLPLYSPITLDKMFAPLAEYLTQETGREFRLVIPRDFEEFVSIVSNGEVDFAYQNPYVYLLLGQRGKLQSLVTTISPEPETSREEFRGVILVRKDSAISSLEDLKGKDIMIVSRRSAGGYRFQKILLRQHGIDIAREARLEEGKKHEEVVLSVYRGEADAGFVREAALQVAKDIVDTSDLRVLATTEYYPNWPFAAYTETDADLVAKVRSALLAIEDPAFLEEARINGFTQSQMKRLQQLKEKVVLE
ncbi:phosphonate ABC transporter, periplasmic phosphonate-binding protein [Desulfohalobium retbaense DSM 5692]|uniref:Phosphonate ABC transporter, periplasmic phosphonate-binding protein n=2 Tax=Desulfohalobium TaxID=45662 RepID=C8WZC2_DESRD|nr:phosphonate ABC transporter, periplasmic phosphonate-binding protein [Desulfohalobium retbaense DSM 5692]